jgi:hypothetical protein
MAVATAAISVYPYPKGVDQTQRMEYIRGTFVISTGGTYPPGGFPLNWSNIEQIKAIPFGSTTPTSTGGPTPFQVQVASAANPPSGYIYLVDGVAGNLHIFEASNSASGNSGPLLEVGGAIDNRIVTDVIQFEAIFFRN